MRIFVLSGWFGRPGSPCMGALANRLSAYGRSTFHGWRDNEVIAELNQEKGKVVVIGFSLGANQLGFIDYYARRRINLGVAYDPSRQSPLVSRLGNEWVQRAPKYNKLICYYNPTDWIFGGSRYDGPNVEIVETALPHLLVQCSETLHTHTIKAIEELT